VSTPAIYRRVVRRETHSSRAGIAIALAVILILVFAWFGIESVLAALGRTPLLVAPKSSVAAVLAAASAPVGALTAGGIVAALIGILLIVVALAPGRRGRRHGSSDRTAAVVDDRVIAQSVAQSAAFAGSVDPDQVHVTVARRSVVVDVTPTSGRPADVEAIGAAVDRELASYDFVPALRGRVRLETKGVVGR